MTKRLSSRYSVCKKLKSPYKNLWGLKKKDFCRSLITKKKRKPSPFSRLLNIKQSLRFFYCNVSENLFKRCIKLSIKSPSKTIDKLSSILESRIDTLIFRSCLVNSFQEARQLISHGFVFVNNICVIEANKKINKGDIIKIKRQSFDKDLFLRNILSRSLPNYLELDLNNLTIILLWDVNFKNTYYPIKEKYTDISRYYK